MSPSAKSVHVNLFFLQNTYNVLKKWGVEIIRTHLFPLFSKFGGLILSVVSLITAIALLGFAIPSLMKYVNGESNSLSELNVVRFSIALASVVLAVIDLILNIWKLIKSCCGNKQEYNIGAEDIETKSCNCSWVKIKTFFSKYILDIFRMMVVEAILYPTVICNILDNTSSRTYAGTLDAKFKFARFILSVGWLIFHVYIVRLLVIGVTKVSLEGMRRGKRILQTANDKSDLYRGWKMFDNEHNIAKDVQ